MTTEPTKAEEAAAAKAAKAEEAEAAKAATTDQTLIVADTWISQVTLPDGEDTVVFDKEGTSVPASKVKSFIEAAAKSGVTLVDKTEQEAGN